ncbi:MAG: glycoside hydrolase family 15 protein [Planctomycetes bacterium]|nr:glycoside hydrolase family 15 protein [Planctomycetota bacterium]
MKDHLEAPRLDHGVIGNGRVLALVSPTSSVDWLCLPQWDSPSVFGRLLDHEQGGAWVVQPPNGEITGKLEYERNTNVLRSTFEQGDAAWQVIDWAPRIPAGIDVRAPFEVVRLILPLRGEPRLRIRFDPRPDYGRSKVSLQPTEHGLVALGGPVALHLTTNAPVPFVIAGTPFVLREPIYQVLGIASHDRQTNLAAVQRSLHLTIAGWRAWARSCGLPPFRQEYVLRSALCLKLHAHHDTGAIIAATTTSIPEAMGTQRTWDYRYCWLRDAAFVVESLRRLGQLTEGESFLRFLRNVAESGPLQPVYGLDGRRELHEEILPHLAGFGGNGFVRVGNAAWSQRQNDLMGELLLSLESLLSDPRLVHENPEQHMPLVERLVRDAIEAAPTPDTGIWEYRTMLKNHTFSRAMCQTAIERGARLARRFGKKDLADTWASVAAREKEEVLSRGYNERLGMFTQGLDGEHPDASNLLLPSIGLIDARDPRFVSTLKAYERDLVDRGFVLRYRNVDDFGDTTSAFTICSFWLAEALALAGRLDDGIAIFDRMISHANPLGLFSEDIDPSTGRLLGNFPQAYTHVGLINAAATIGDLLAAREGVVRAWA